MKRNFFPIMLALFAGSLVAGCNKPDSVELPNEGTIYMPQAAGTRARIDLQLSTKPQEVSFGAAYGGLNYSDADNEVTFKVDPMLVASYNSMNGTDYKVLPDSVYTISGLKSVIRKGSTSSDPLTVTVSSTKVRFGVRYMLPITLVSSTHGKIDSALRTSYFRFDTIQRKSVDVTAQGTISVSNENGGGAGAGEGSPKLVDGNTGTKYLINPFVANMWFDLKFPTPINIGAYTFTSGNDASARDPKNWTLQGSNNGTTWTILDTRTNEMFSARTQTRRFELPVSMTQTYSQYRIYVSANNGDGLFQMAEWRLIRYE